MSKRRAHGEGSIYLDANRDRWVGTLDVGRDPASGSRRRVKVTGDSRADVAKRLRARRQAIQAGDTAPATMSVADLLDQWEGAVVATMTPNTARDNSDHARAARAGLGAVRLVDLRAHHVETFLTARADAGLSRSVVRRSRFTLARALRWGQRRDLVARNAAELSEMPPTPPPAEGRALTAPELRQLLSKAAGSRYEALWWTMAGLGLRPGEARALSWADVDLDGAVIHVRHALKLHDGRPVLGELKTAKSRRSLAMPAPVVDALRAHRLRWTEERLALGADWPTEWSDLVFVTENGRPLDPNNAHRTLSRLAKAAGLGHLRPYDLRHTAASLMADSGTRIEQVADVLGHAGLHLARSTYIHTTAPTVDSAAAPMGDALTADG